VQCIPSTPCPHDTTPERLAPPWPYGSSPKEQSQGSDSSHRWEPEPQIPHPELSTRLSKSLGTVGIPSSVQDLCFFWKQRCWRQGSEWQALPRKGTCSLPCSLAPYPRLQLAVPWATGSSQDFLAILCPALG